MPNDPQLVTPQPATPQRRARLLVYTIPQAAAELHVCTRHLWRLISQDKIRVVKLGVRATRIPAIELERLANEGV